MKRDQQETRSPDKNSIILVSILAAFIPPFMASSLNVALPTIGREFSMPAVHLSWLITAYLLSIGVFIVPFGRAGDLYGRRTIFLWGTVIYTCATLCAAMAGGAAMLLCFRIVQGAGAAMIFGTGMAMLIAAIPPERRGFMLGINVSVTYIGLSLGPPLGGILTQQFGWRSIFYSNIPLSVLIIAVVFFKIGRDKNDRPGESFDYKGSFIYAAALVALMYGLSTLPGIHGIVSACAGAAGFIVFAVIERGTTSPLLCLGLFRRNTVFAFSSLAALLNYSATHGAGFFLSMYLQYIKGMPPQSAGIIMIAWPLFMAAFSPFAGRLSDWIEPRIVASLGMGSTALGLFFLSRITAVSSIGFIVMGLVMIGVGVAFFSSPNTSAIMGSVEKTYYGMASSIVATMRLIGQILSMGISAVVLGALVGNVVITPERHAAFVESVRITFVIFGSLCTLGIFASLSRGRVRIASDPKAKKPGQVIPEID
jgi:MFS family permease